MIAKEQMITRTVTMGTFSDKGRFVQYVSFWKQDADTGQVLSYRVYPKPSESSLVKLADVLFRLHGKVSLASRGWSVKLEDGPRSEQMHVDADAMVAALEALTEEHEKLNGKISDHLAYDTPITGDDLRTLCVMATAVTKQIRGIVRVVTESTQSGEE